MIVGIVALTTLLLIGIVSFFTGDIVSANFAPFVPLSGAWDRPEWALIFWRPLPCCLVNLWL